MATIENWESRTIRSGGGDEVTLSFDIVGSNDDATAIIDLETNAPATWRGLPQHSYSLSWKSLGVWSAEVIYRLQTNPQNQQEPANVGSTTGQVSLSIGGETVTRTYSDQTVNSYGTNPPDHNQAIGVGTDGSIDGCDVLVPTATYSETHYFLPASLTQTYRKTVIELTGTVNDDTWKTFDAGSVRFDGAEFSLSDGRQVVATYNFSISPNVTGLTVGSVSGIDKDGWDYLV